MSLLFSEHNIIIIVVQKQIFLNEKCKIIRLYPIPNFENKNTVNVPEKIIKCKDKLMDIDFKSIKDNCVIQLFKSKIEHCKYETNLNSEIISDTPGIIITTNLEETTLIQNCIQDKIKIRGNNLIIFNNCTIKIFEKIFSSYDTTNDFKFINNEIKLIKPIIFKTELKEVKELHMENLKEITLIKKTNKINHTIDLILGIIITFLIIVIIVIIRNKNVSKAIDVDINLKDG